jgi:hypothetical protein
MPLTHWILAVSLDDSKKPVMVGPMRFAFELIANETSVQFKLIRAWFCLIPLPRFLAPRLEAIETACECGWDVLVQFSLPLLGMLIRYEGRVLVDPIQS